MNNKNNELAVDENGDASKLSDLLCVFSQGVCADGASILKNGEPMSIEQIIEALRSLRDLVEVKKHKDRHGKDEWYKDAQPMAWEQARKVLDT